VLGLNTRFLNNQSGLLTMVGRKLVSVTDGRGVIFSLLRCQWRPNCLYKKPLVPNKFELMHRLAITYALAESTPNDSTVDFCGVIADGNPY
jgi:hypothetical protein